MRQKTLRVATLVDDVTRPRSQARVPRLYDSWARCHGRQARWRDYNENYTIIFAICQHPNFLYACLRKLIPVQRTTVVNYRGVIAYIRALTIN